MCLLAPKSFSLPQKETISMRDRKAKSARVKIYIRKIAVDRRQD